MKSINIESILTIIFVIVDDWYHAKGAKILPPKRVGRKASFSNSEVITLMLAIEILPYAGELQFLAYIRANHLTLFPKLLSQSQFNRRARSLRKAIEALRQHWLEQAGMTVEDCFLLDTKPIPVVGYKRSKKRSEFAGSASYGYCASRKLYYFGYKLVMISTLNGLPIAYDLVPANIDERQAAETVLTYLHNALVIGDKGFIGQEWQRAMQQQNGVYVLTPKRANQKEQFSAGFEQLLNAMRERIEGVFHEIQNTGRHIERLLAKTVVGLATRVAIKVTAHFLKRLLRLDYGLDIQTFQVLPNFAL